MEVKLPDTYEMIHMFSPFVLDCIVYEPWPADHPWADGALPDAAAWRATTSAEAQANPSFDATLTIPPNDWLAIRRRPRALMNPEAFSVLGSKFDPAENKLYTIAQTSYAAEMSMYAMTGETPTFEHLYRVLAALFVLRGFVLNRKRDWAFAKHLPADIVALIPTDYAGPVEAP
jgi:hypothetical protein